MVNDIVNTILFLWLILFLLKNNIESTNSSTPTLKALWLKYKHDSHNPTRLMEVQTILSKATGIYLNQSLAKNRFNNRLIKTLNSTVLISVIEMNDSSDKYEHFLRNLLCFYHFYHFKTVVYVIDTKNKSIKELDFGENVFIISYPFELFWQIISNKSTALNTGFGKGNYLGNKPSFENFGSLVMLVPILETLNLGFNVVFFDVDVALIQDPIPHLVRSNIDIIVAPELRTCHYPTYYAETNWEVLEPNTGIMFLRSTKPAIDWFKSWLDRIVAENTMNDQRSVQFQNIPNSFMSKECKNRNYNSTSNDEFIDQNKSFTYCFLNEFQFQNGLIDLHCSKGKRGTTIAGYNIGMEENAFQTVDQFNRIIYSPITLHANFFNSKKKALEERALWLYNSLTSNKDKIGLSLLYTNKSKFDQNCLDYNFMKTSFAIKNWTEDLIISHKVLNSYHVNISENQTVKFFNRGGVYIYSKGVLHLIPTREIFFSLNLSFEDVKLLNHHMHRLIYRVGSDITSQNS
eukprot:gene11273-15125_t